MAREGITAIRRGLDETKRAMHAVLSALKSVQDWDIVTAELRVSADENFRVSLPSSEAAGRRTPSQSKQRTSHELVKSWRGWSTRG
jgi:hypothetical protein